MNKINTFLFQISGYIDIFMHIITKITSTEK